MMSHQNGFHYHYHMLSNVIKALSLTIAPLQALLTEAEPCLEVNTKLNSEHNDSQVTVRLFQTLRCSLHELAGVDPSLL